MADGGRGGAVVRDYLLKIKDPAGRRAPFPARRIPSLLIADMLCGRLPVRPLRRGQSLFPQTNWRLLDYPGSFTGEDRHPGSFGEPEAWGG